MIQDQLDSLPHDDNWAVAAAKAILDAAVQARCSDLHLLMLPDGAPIRGRRHGTLFRIGHVPPDRQETLVGRFKVLARLPAFVRHVPQDGRIEWQNGNGRPQVLRVSLLPTIHGESLVIRFPQRDEGEFTIEQLGMPPNVLEAADRALARQEGVIALTGPTSSGKSTTLYAMMRRLHERHGERLNFVTIEDPVERDLRFASQVQVNEAQELTFAKALRSVLRHDPGVLLIGEIRDAETALIAAQAGMSGGIVLSTLHAGRAWRVPVRLLSMGLPPYLVASALNTCIAQRLARVLCQQCGGASHGDGSRGASVCEACAGTGVQGRVGLFELVSLDERLREMILERAAPHQLAAHARSLRVGDLAAQAAQLVEAHVISRGEAELILAMDERD